MSAVTEMKPTTSFTTLPTLPRIDQLYFSLINACFVVGTIGNAFALHYFTRKKLDVANITYIFIASFDLAISILVLPIALSFITDNNPLLENFILCNFCGILWYISMFMSVFLVAVMSITRSICIVFPFAKVFIRRKLVVGIIVSYLIIIAIQSTIPYWSGHQYEFSGWVCEWRTDVIPDTTTNAYRDIYRNVMSFEMYALILPILVSCGVTLFVLNKRSNKMSGSHRSVTITIVCFTCLYVFCNLPVTITNFLIVLSKTFNFQLNAQWDPHEYFLFLFQVLSIGLNSALNPCIYLWRTAAFRRHVFALIRCRVPEVYLTVNNRPISMPANTSNLNGSTYLMFASTNSLAYSPSSGVSPVNYRSLPKQGNGTSGNKLTVPQMLHPTSTNTSNESIPVTLSVPMYRDNSSASSVTKISTEL